MKLKFFIYVGYELCILFIFIILLLEMLMKEY